MFKIDRSEKKSYLNRFSSLENLYKFPVRYILHKLSKKHIKKNNQLIVFSFDHIAHTINLDGLYEKTNLEFFIEWIKSNCPSILNGTVLDIGANIGNHSLFFSNYFNKVISFEPHPKIFKVLGLNTESKRNIEIHNFGASNKNGNNTMVENNLNMGGSRLTKNKKNTNLNVALKKLDDFCKEHKNITLLKIDTEGHELEVLEGAIDIIKKNKPIIIFEQQKSDFTDGSSSMINFLININYSSFGIILKGPSFGCQFPKILDIIFGLLFRQYIKLKIVSKIKANYYPFIIALPDE